jgi:hypothetical protein
MSDIEPLQMSPPVNVLDKNRKSGELSHSESLRLLADILSMSMGRAWRGG